MARGPRTLEGKVVAITGGARGIGRATAAAFLAEGARVAIGDLDAGLSMSAAAELDRADARSGAGAGAGAGVVAQGCAIGLELDVTSRESFSGFLRQVEQRLGPLDVLVNNAGIQPVGDFADERDAVTARALQVNLGGVALGCKLALERLRPRDSGHIVNIASGLGRTPMAGGVTYCASKYAVVGLTEALRLELEGTRVELHLVLPGLADTEMSAGLRGMRGSRRLTPDEVGAAVVEAVRSGRAETYVPRSLGRLVAVRRLIPRRLVRIGERLLRSDSLMTRVDDGDRADYHARIAPAADAGTADAAATVASAADVVADAMRAGRQGRESTVQKPT